MRTAVSINRYICYTTSRFTCLSSPRFLRENRLTFTSPLHRPAGSLGRGACEGPSFPSFGDRFRAHTYRTQAPSEQLSFAACPALCIATPSLDSASKPWGQSRPNEHLLVLGTSRKLLKAGVRLSSYNVMDKPSRSRLTIIVEHIPRGSYVWDLSAHSILGRSRVPLPQGPLPASTPSKTWLLGSSASTLHGRLASIHPSKGTGPITRSRAASSEPSVWGKSFLKRPHG
ncbi:uncharacterized protein CC84DRAFT_273152 [Paraphaeosphaeria sporulosa]|uniref:Uncharacterized protein n=1 Tax=Paraphaeosphaeria sporulosa TaxID=1460663 RepID=A0A177C252_9PLEO|nr:uncharacterized protein CC84DRAFT_273152 [Paraphaeosphaeria sporulosa]OAG00932.1 hypothetical protein CC84DRAFT_273152 [Paraphaeosphaeria sporulosa]